VKNKIKTTAMNLKLYEHSNTIRYLNHSCEVNQHLKIQIKTLSSKHSPMT